MVDSVVSSWYAWNGKSQFVEVAGQGHMDKDLIESAFYSECLPVRD